MKNILNVFIVLAIILSPIFSYAQKCNLDVDETDAFTNEHVRAGSNNVGSSSMHWKFTLNQKGSKYGWELKIVYNKNLQENIKKGDAILCKLENGKIVKLISDNDYPPSFKAFGDGVVITTITPKGNMEADDMKSFGDSPLSEMRATLSGQTIEPKISSKQGAEMQEIAACLLKK
jgi:hypothetical protein